jgi:hypothetical protein
MGLLLLPAPWIPSLVLAADRDQKTLQPLEQVKRAFRQEDPVALRPLLREEEKVRVSSPTLGLNTGYYSPDQISLMLRELFEVRTTIRFEFLGDPPIPSRSPQMRAVARWTYRQGGTPQVSADLVFNFANREGAWCLREIRDVR